eukprot:TRINITY_DN8944_c1_g1_i3.p1 TRINITY_DN8944_c1_g1~~TRINITY_DN8944_c1_g1_i3.p1  ORF type:complete len:216 (-),score=-16.31 TRINITY_DN8944_c1_g1_i3:251-898(-)
MYFSFFQYVNMAINKILCGQLGDWGIMQRYSGGKFRRWMRNYDSYAWIDYYRFKYMQKGKISYVFSIHQNMSQTCRVPFIWLNCYILHCINLSFRCLWMSVTMFLAQRVILNYGWVVFHIFIRLLCSLNVVNMLNISSQFKHSFSFIFQYYKAVSLSVYFVKHIDNFQQQLIIISYQQWLCGLLVIIKVGSELIWGRVYDYMISIIGGKLVKRVY